jgi:hypothetical protein
MIHRILSKEIRPTYRGGFSQMYRGGFREGAGRPKGSQNKRTQIIAQKAAEEGTTQIEVMLKAMRTPWGRLTGKTAPSALTC